MLSFFRSVSGGKASAALCAFFFLVAGIGCKSTYKETKVGAAAPPILRNDSKIYIARPFDVSYKQQVISNSGKQAASALLDSFSRNTKSAYMGKNPEGVQAAIETAKRLNAEYLVYPHLLKWEDHATEYTGVRDRLVVRIELIDPASGGIVYAREIEARSKWMTDGGDTPQDLLADPFDHFTQVLFRNIEVPTALQ